MFVYIPTGVNQANNPTITLSTRVYKKAAGRWKKNNGKAFRSKDRAGRQDTEDMLAYFTLANQLVHPLFESSSLRGTSHTQT